MHWEPEEEAAVMAEKNRRLQALVGELLKKNELLRQQLLLLQQLPAGSRLGSGTRRAGASQDSW